MLPILRLLLVALLFMPTGNGITPPQISAADQQNAQKAVADIMGAIPKNGLGIITAIKNDSIYPASLVYEKTVHDQLPADSVVAINYLSHKKFLSALKPTDPKTPWLLAASTDTADDKHHEATFAITRHLSSSGGRLKDWLGFSAQIADGKMLQCDKDGIAGFYDKGFNDDEKDQDSHWEIVGTSLENCYLRNRKTGGILTYYEGKRDVEVEHSEKTIFDTAVMAIQKMPLKPVPLTSGSHISLRSMHNTWLNAPGFDVKLAATGSPEEFILFRINPANGDQIGGVINYGDTIALANARLTNSGGGWTFMYPWQSRYNVSFYDNGKNGANTPGQCNSHHTHWTIEPHPMEPAGWGTPIGCDKPVCFRTKRQGIYAQNYLSCTPNGPVDVHAPKPDTWERWWITAPGGAPRLPAPDERYLYEQDGATYAFDGKWNKDGPWTETFVQITIQNDTSAWGIAASGNLWYWNGKAWSNWQPVSASQRFISLSVSSDGDLFGITVDKKLLYYKVNVGWIPLPVSPAPAQYGLAVRDATEVWYIGTDGWLYKTESSGKIVTKQDAPGNGVLDVSVASDGALWLVKNNGQLWHLLNGTWAIKPGLANMAFVKLAVKSDIDVWAIGSDGGVYHRYNNDTWYGMGLPTACNCIAVASGSRTEVTSKKETRTFQQLITRDPTDTTKPCPGTDDNRVTINVIELGAGGNIGSRETIDTEIAARQKPEVTGYAETEVTLAQGAVLSVNPLQGRGAAWPQQSFPTANRCCITFLACTGDVGGIEVIFGEKVSDSFIYKVRIGAEKNTTASVIERKVSAEHYDDTIVFELHTDQNELAATSPGNFTPYWVSYDNGLIMAGIGSPGDNVFMAYRATPAANQRIDRVGFGSQSGPVQYADIKYLPPVTVGELARSYVKQTTTLAIPASTDQITWTSTPFRAANRGTIGFATQSDDVMVLALGQDKDTALPHYLVELDVKNDGSVTIKKWDTDNKSYVDRVTLQNSAYKGLSVDAKSWTKAWVSYNEGLFIIGSGDIGQTPAFVYHDLNPFDKITQVGFGSFGSTGGNVKNITIAPALDLETEAIKESYAKQTKATSGSFSGTVKIVLPFDYTISQNGPQLEVRDAITNQTTVIAGMPQQGAEYRYRIMIGATGALSAALASDPDNPLQAKIQQDIVTAQASAQLDQAKAAASKEAGQIQADLTKAASAQMAAQAAALQKQATTETSAGAALVGASIKGGASATNPFGGMVGGIGMAVGVGVGLGITNQGLQTASLAKDKLNQAAANDYFAAQQTAGAQSAALQHTNEAALQQFQANLLAGQAQFAFKKSDAYVYVDKPERPALGSSALPPDVASNQQKATDGLNQLDAVSLDDKPGLEKTIMMLQNIVYLISNGAVVNDFIQHKFADKLSTTYDAYMALFEQKAPDVRLASSFIKLVLSAINNGFLSTIAGDTATRKTWYTWANDLAQQLIKTQKGIKLPPCFGEYLWLPFQAKTADDLTISFEAQAQNDVFVCFAKNPDRIRNTETELYEIVIGGWDNSKTAIRLQSLGQAVTMFKKDDNPEAMINPYVSQRYTLSLKKGVVSLQSGDNTPVTWTDPYPLKGITWVGISSWDVPVTISSIEVKNGDKIISGSKTPAPAPTPTAVKPATPTKSPTPAPASVQVKTPAKPVAKPEPEPTPDTPTDTTVSADASSAPDQVAPDAAPDTDAPTDTSSTPDIPEISVDMGT